MAAEDENRFIKTSKEQFSAILILLELTKTILDVIIIIFSSIIGFFLPARRKDLRGEIVLITGSAGYIGRRLAVRFAEKGAFVVLWDVKKQDNDKLAEEIEEMGGKAFSYACDLRDKKDIQKKASDVISDVGNPTILVNNAGIVAGKNLLDMKESDIEASFDINILAHFWAIRMFLPAMIEKKHGHIVAVASILGTDGLGQLTEYCATKFAVNGFMQSLRREMALLGHDGIHFTTVNPFVIDTELFQGVTIRFSKMPFLNVLKPDYVADKIMEAVETNQIMLNIPRICYFIPVLISVLPMKAADRLQRFLGSTEAMTTFIGRKKKD